MKTLNSSEKHFTISRLIMVFSVILLLVSAAGCMNKEKTDSSVNANGQTGSGAASNDLVYVQVDALPVFTGGDTAILNYVAKNTVYPAEAKLNNIQGRVVVKMVVRRDGSVTDAEVIQSANPLLDAEALRVVKTLPKFEKPGYKDGVPVSVYYMLPISFTLK